MNTAEQTANVFHIALKANDWLGLRRVLTDDASWLLPGENAISGPAENAEAVVKRAQLIAKYGMRFNLKKILFVRKTCRSTSTIQLNLLVKSWISLSIHYATCAMARFGRLKLL